MSKCLFALSKWQRHDDLDRRHLWDFPSAAICAEFEMEIIQWQFRLFKLSLLSRKWLEQRQLPAKIP